MKSNSQRSIGQNDYPHPKALSDQKCRYSDRISIFVFIFLFDSSTFRHFDCSTIQPFILLTLTTQLTYERTR